MQVTEVAATGLKREYKVTVPAGDIDSQVQARLKRLAQTVRMPGFRPGKAPVGLLKRQYGRQVLAEIFEKTVDDGAKRVVNDNKLRPALQPKIEVTSFDEGKDLEFKMDVEVLPDVPEVKLEEITVERPTAPVSDEAVDEALNQLAAVRREYEPVTEPRPAQDGDKVKVDFLGKRDGEPFEGGKAEGFELVLGQNRMIPGFEEAMLGKSAGEPFSFDVTFPENYGEASLAGKPATFEATIQEIAAPKEQKLDDEFAKNFGAEGLEDLKAKMRERMEAEHAQRSRSHAKRDLLDKLAEAYVFEVPAGMVDMEFEAIWRQVEQQMKREGSSFPVDGQSEEEAREEYRGIAERRVRLGLILSDLGVKNGVQVEQQELQRAAISQARQFPGQEKLFFEQLQKNPQLIDQLKAPIFEDKVVDFALAKAKVEEREVTVEELMRDPDDDAAEAAGEAEAKAEDSEAAKSDDAPLETAAQDERPEAKA